MTNLVPGDCFQKSNPVALCFVQTTVKMIGPGGESEANTSILCDALYRPVERCGTDSWYCSKEPWLRVC